MTSVYYTSSMVPPELIAACGLTPRRLAPTADTDSRHEGLCSFAAAWLSALEHRHTAGPSFVSVFSSACDQMRRCFDLRAAQCPAGTFLLNVPATTSENAFAWYKQELSRLAEFLCSISGQTPDWTKPAAHTGPQSASCSARLQIAVTGESTPASLLNALRSVVRRYSAGVLDLTENTLLPASVSELAQSRDPLERIARAYFETPAIWKHPNAAWFQRLTESVHHHRAAGVIVFRHNFCDLWRPVKHELAARLSVPVLELDLDGRDRLPEWALSRIEAFMETVQ